MSILNIDDTEPTFFGQNKKRFQKMKSIRTIFLVFFTSVVSVLHSDVGDSINEAKAQYGEPYAEMVSGEQKVNLYRTSKGNIREVYNARGICIESQTPNNNLSKVTRPTPEPRTYRVTPRVTTTPKSVRIQNQSINDKPMQTMEREAVLKGSPSHISPREQATRPDLQSILPAKPRTRIVQNDKLGYFRTLKNTVPFAILLILGTVIIGFIFAAINIKRKSPKPCANTSDEIEALCEFEQRKNSQKPLAQSQQIPNKKYYENHPAA